MPSRSWSSVASARSTAARVTRARRAWCATFSESAIRASTAARASSRCRESGFDTASRLESIAALKRFANANTPSASPRSAAARSMMPGRHARWYERWITPGALAARLSTAAVTVRVSDSSAVSSESGDG